MIAAQLDDGASAAEVMPVIRETAQRWLERQVRGGLLPASAGGALDDLARAVHDQRYELGPVTAYLRDPQVENVDINGCDQKLMDSPKPSGAAGAGQRVAVSYPPANVEGFVEDKHQQQARADDHKPDHEKHDQRSPAFGRRPTPVRLSLLRCHLRSSGWRSVLEHIYPMEAEDHGSRPTG